MSAPEDDIADPMDDAYRRASAAEAGRPSAATRAAILAEARAAAAARAASSPQKPASNEPWFSWRIAASLAVVGVALILWRQLPRDATRVLEAPSAPVATFTQPAPAAPAEGAPPAQNAEPAAPKLDLPRGDRKAERAAESSATALSNVTDKPLPPPAPVAALSQAVAPVRDAVIVDLNAKEAVPESQGAAVASSRRLPEGIVLRRTEPRADFGALVRRDFPAMAKETRPPVGVWLLLDATGRTLRSGMLERGQSLGSVLTSLQRDLPDRRLRPFDTGIVRIESGATILVGVARAD